MMIVPELLSAPKPDCTGVPGKRKGGEATCSMADIGLPAFALFFMQSESFLEYQRALEEGPEVWSLFNGLTGAA